MSSSVNGSMDTNRTIFEYNMEGACKINGYITWRINYNCVTIKA